MTTFNTFMGLLLAASITPVWQLTVVGVVVVAFLAYCIFSTVHFYKSHDLPWKKTKTEQVVNTEQDEQTVMEEPKVEETQEPAVNETNQVKAEEKSVQEEHATTEVVEEQQATTEEVATEVKETGSDNVETDEENDEAAEQRKVVVVRYSKSFMAKLCCSDEGIKTYYQRITDRFLSYKKVSSRVSWSYAVLSRGRTVLAKMIIRGKTLRLYLALDVSDVAKKYHATAVSSKKFSATPCYIKIKSERGLKFALELVDVVCNKYQIPFNKDVTVTSETKFEADTMEHLINKGLIKIKVVNGGEITPDATIVTESFAFRK